MNKQPPLLFVMLFDMGVVLAIAGFGFAALLSLIGVVVSIYYALSWGASLFM